MKLRTFYKAHETKRTLDNIGRNVHELAWNLHEIEFALM